MDHFDLEMEEWNKTLNGIDDDIESYDAYQASINCLRIHAIVRHHLGISSGNLELALDAAERQPLAASASYEKRIAAGDPSYDVVGELWSHGLGGYHPNDICDIVVACLALELGLTYGVPGA